MSDIVLVIPDVRLRQQLAASLEAAGYNLTRAESLPELAPAMSIVAAGELIRISSGNEPEVELPNDVAPAVVVAIVNTLGRAAKAEAAVRRSKDDLRQLAWAVGHDLAEPLRSIVSYNQLLERRYKDLLDDDGRVFIEHTVAAAQRMRAFLTDLLTFSQVITDTALAFGPVSMEAIFWAVNMSLHDVIAQANARLTHDPLPTVRGNETRLTQLLQALVSNSLKFVRENTTPEVHVAVSETGSEWLFSVTDNGPGIEAQYYDRIFEPFRRLHGREIAGSGLGLALARVIVEAHGGRIWPEATPEGGTRMLFTLPKRD